MNQKNQRLLLILSLSIVSTVLVWLPFFAGFNSFLGFKIPPGGLKNVFANYDGPNYLIIAKTWYQRDLIARTFSLPLPLEYYPAHFPGYPLLIWLIGQFLTFPQAMLAVTLITAGFSAVVFYLFLEKNQLSVNPLWLVCLFLFLPARQLVVRSVGAPEPLFILAILASFYFFREKNYWLAGIFGAVAQITKTPAILLFLTYIIYLIYQRFSPKITTEKNSRNLIPSALPLILIPLSALLVFSFYWLQTGDFWAYFHSGDNFHLTLLPFQVFNSSRSWLGDIWVEDVIWLYLITGLGVILLFKRKLIDLGIFSLLFYLATIFIAHRDISRYSLPLWPFVLIGLDPLLQKKEFKIIFFIILPAIYLYTLNFILGNRAPIADWTPYL